MRKLALSGLVAAATLLGSAIPLTASAATIPPAAAALAIARPAASVGLVAGGLGGRISCSSPTVCLAVGSDINSAGFATPVAEALHGTTWKSVAVKTPYESISTELTGVSCKAASYCLVVGNYTSKAGLTLPYVLSWNGSSLTAIVKAPLPSGDVVSAIGGVSCVAVRSCVMFGSAYPATGLTEDQFAWTWNGSKWGRKLAGSLSGSQSEEFTAASCLSLTSCFEAGIITNPAGGLSELLATWDGTSLSTQTIAAALGSSVLYPADLSCFSGTHCAVAGFGFNLNTSTTTSAYGFAQVWNGSAWTTGKWTGAKGATIAVLLGVSCAAADNCVAVGASGSAKSGAAASLVWNGTHWAAVAVPGVGKGITTEFSGVSCLSAGSCVAIGAYGPPTATNGTPLAGYLHGGSWRLQHA